jgi:hypothetical protein
LGSVNIGRDQAIMVKLNHVLGHNRQGHTKQRKKLTRANCGIHPYELTPHRPDAGHMLVMKPHRWCSFQAQVQL